MTIFLSFTSTLLLLATVAGSLPLRGFYYDLAANFMLQYAITAAVLLVLALFAGSGFSLACATIALVLSLYQVSPFLLRTPFSQTPGPSVRILQSNMLFTNRNIGGLMKLIESDDPDVIVICEANGGHAAYLRDIMRLYPYQLSEPQQKTPFGMAIASRLPLNNVQTDIFADEGIAAFAAEIPRDGKTAILLSVHLANPLKNFDLRERQLGVIARWVKAQRYPVIVTGDFNLTPYAQAYKDFVRATGLRSARLGRGLHGTFHSKLPAIARLPIDHTFIGDGLGVRTYRTAVIDHSDHLGTVVTVVMQK